MIRFFRYATASLEEARVRLLDGADRGYFDRNVCADALGHAAKCGTATTNLIKSLNKSPIVLRVRRSGSANLPPAPGV